ncbi:sensor histidine kinase [Rikenella microfusus]|uniref:sensor histidine kinase n=1 Tax=Rikenella microfusus TaxID=28139 RepID=UPI001D9AD7B5|nr:HAMP domain-containing sensor histidine kinase [Rikenella microfusus]HJE88657.1 HAMP domain-containing histidine kinase [Rikenella microfusus]
MKLIWRLTFRISFALSLLLAGWAVFFYVAVIDEVNDEADDALEEYSERIIRRHLGGEPLPAADDGTTTIYSVVGVDAAYADHYGPERYSDDEAYIPALDDEAPVRVLKTIFRDAEGRYFELTAATPTIEKEDLQEAVFNWVVILYLALLLSVVFIGGWVLWRSLRPLYVLLKWLDEYTVGGRNAPLDNPTRVTEFRKLTDAARRSAERTERLFEEQKQFIGNASHEMQTPLAVCRNRLEMVAADPDLPERQLGEVLSVLQTLESLTRLNRTLLLLSKIDNGQFPESEEVCLNDVLESHLEAYAEIYGHRGISLRVERQGRMRCAMNGSLAEMLVTNLLKNAYVHNRPGGSIFIRITDRSLMFANTGDPLPFDRADLFKRFRQGGRREDSTGLGLALAESICKRYGMEITYAYADGEHRFTVSRP